jgi:hypothetical protein
MNKKIIKIVSGFFIFFSIILFLYGTIKLSRAEDLKVSTQSLNLSLNLNLPEGAKITASSSNPESNLATTSLAAAGLIFISASFGLWFSSRQENQG